jgi:hypothetical protein
MRTRTTKKMIQERPNFELYKSNICHRVKNEGDLSFIRNVIISDEVSILFNKGWHVESLYLLAMLDYLSRINDVPLYTSYECLRKAKFSKILFPLGIRVLCIASGNDHYKEESIQESIPEFLRHNIVEAEIRNVC